MSETVNIAIQIACNAALLLAGISIGRSIERRKAMPVLQALFSALIDARADNGDTSAASIRDLIDDLKREAQSND